MLSLDVKTIALLAIVSGLIILCLGLWYVWNSQQILGSEMLYLKDQQELLFNKLKASSLTHAASVHANDKILNNNAPPVHNNESCMEMNTKSDNTTNPQHDSTVVEPNDTIIHRADAYQQNQHDTHANGSHYSEENESCEDSHSDAEDPSNADSDSDYDDNDMEIDKTDLLDSQDTHQTEKETQNTDYSNNLVQSLLSDIVKVNTDNKLDDYAQLQSSTMVQTHEQAIENSTNTPNVSTTTEIQDMNSEQNENDNVNENVNENVTSSTTDYNHTETKSEDYLHNSGDMQALLDSLRSKTVVELKKLCADHEIGVRVGKKTKRKEELIEELAEKLPAIS